MGLGYLTPTGEKTSPLQRPTFRRETPPMSFDSLTLRIVTDELHQTLIGGTIRHIEQANPTTFSLKIVKADKPIGSRYPHIPCMPAAHLIQKSPQGQKQSYFADFLLTHLKHGTITEIEQLGWGPDIKNYSPTSF